MMNYRKLHFANNFKNSFRFNIFNQYKLKYTFQQMRKQHLQYAQTLTRIADTKNQTSVLRRSSNKLLLGQTISSQLYSSNRSKNANKHDKNYRENKSSAKKDATQLQVFMNNYLADSKQLYGAKSQISNSTNIKQMNIQKFLKILYSKKSEDLLNSQNTKHQKNFIQKLKNTINDEQFVAIQCDFKQKSIKLIGEYVLNKPIKWLNLSKNCLGDSGAIVLNQTLPKLEHLQILELVSINVTPKGSKKILQALKFCLKMIKFDFSSKDGLYRNRIGKQCANDIFQLFHREQNAIKVLALENSYICQDGLKSLCQGISKDSPLAQLNLAQNQLTEQSMKKFCEKFKHIKLESLHLQRNNIGDQGLDLLAKMIGNTYHHHHSDVIPTGISYLNLEKNNIRSIGLQSFCRQLSNDQSLKQLILDHNHLGEGQRFFSLKNFLCRNWSLKKLSLKKCLTNPEDFKLLSEGLQINRSLQQLNISENNFTTETFNHFILSLSKNKNLKVLIMQGCNIGDTYLNKLSIITNTTLTTWKLGNNFIHDKGAAVIIKFLEKNRKLNKICLKKNCVSLTCLKEIDNILKENKIIAENEGPDMSYFQYVEQMQNRQRQILVSSIEKLKEKYQRFQLKSLIANLIDYDVQIDCLTQEINREQKQLVNLQKQIVKNTNSETFYTQ